MFKKVATLGLVCSMILSLVSVNAYDGKDLKSSNSIESVMDTYYEQSKNNQRSRTSNIQLAQNTVDTLNELGHQSFIVTQDNFDKVEDEINTDLSYLNLTQGEEYILTIQDSNFKSQRSSADTGIGGSTSSYRFNGKTYYFRTVYVTYIDNPSHSQVSYVDLLKNDTTDDLIRIADTLISTVIGNVDEWAATTMSLLGISVGDIEVRQHASLIMQAATDWTRVYTQIYDEKYNEYTFASRVEYVNTDVMLTGYYYGKGGKRYINETVRDRFYSDHYFDDTWKKKTAVLMYLGYGPDHWDSIVYVDYKLGEDIKIEHNGFF